MSPYPAMRYDGGVASSSPATIFTANQNIAVMPLVQPALEAPLRLAPFARERHARDIVSWVRTPLEAFQLAPKSPPPLTIERVAEWAGPGRAQFVLTDLADNRPLAYGELNTMENSRADYWLGHLIVDPARRGEGLGTRLTRMLLHRAFMRLHARRVCLVVFYENFAAISAYRTAGLYADGWEDQQFPAYGRSARLLRMVATSYD